MNCPLCQSTNHEKFDEDKFRSYLRCLDCSLVFIPRDKILSFKDEASRYESHQNDDHDASYRSYLTQVVEGFKPQIKKGQVGLDFGSGRTTLLSKIAASYGIEMDSYDLYFHPKEEIWNKKYDFIVLSEVIEHLSDPHGVMKKLYGLLKKHGQFFIKTKFYPPDKDLFRNWFYKRDMTHVQFFDEQSMSFLADALKMRGPFKLSAPDLHHLKDR